MAKYNNGYTEQLTGKIVEKERFMSSVVMNVSISQIAETIKRMSPAEIETLLIEMDHELSRELKKRKAQLNSEIEKNKVLTIEEVFDV